MCVCVCVCVSVCVCGVIPKRKKWYLISPGLTFSIIRYDSSIKWSNLGNEVAPPHQHLGVVDIKKGVFGSPSTKVSHFPLIHCMLLRGWFKSFTWVKVLMWGTIRQLHIILAWSWRWKTTLNCEKQDLQLMAWCTASESAVLRLPDVAWSSRFLKPEQNVFSYLITVR